MKRPLLIGLALVAVAALAFGAWSWQRAGARRDRIVAGLPALPAFGSATATTRERIQQADAAARARFGCEPALGRLSRLYHANGFYGEALACYDLLERLEPSEPRWFHRHASILSGYGDGDPALQLWAHVLALAPDYFVARLRIGDSELKAGHPDAAAAAYQAVLKSSHDNPYALLGLARLDMEAHRWDSARERLESATRQTERLIGGDLLVTVYQQLGHPELAREILGASKAGGFFRDTPDPWLDELIDDCFDPYRLTLASGIANHTGNPVRAVQLLQRGLAVAPNDVATHFQLGSLYDEQHDLPAALEQFARCTILAPDFSDGWVWLSNVQTESGDAAAANRSLAEGLNHCPGSPGLHLMYARQLEQANRVGEAVNEYLTSIRLRPNEPDAYVSLGSLFIKLGRTDDGIQQMRQALAADPGDPSALSVMAFTSITTNDKPEARRWMQRVTEQLRIPPPQYNQLAQAYRDRFGEDWTPAPHDP